MVTTKYNYRRCSRLAKPNLFSVAAERPSRLSKHIYYFENINSKRAQTSQNSFNHPNNTQITRKFEFKIHCRSLGARVMKKVLLLLRRLHCRLVRSCLPTAPTLLPGARSRRSEIKEKTKSGSRMQRVKIKGKRQCLMEKDFVSPEFSLFLSHQHLGEHESVRETSKNANSRVIKKSEMNGRHFTLLIQSARPQSVN